MNTQYICFVRLTDTETSKVYYDVYTTYNLDDPYYMHTKNYKLQYLYKKYVAEGKGDDVLRADILQFFSTRTAAVEYMIEHVTENYTA